MPETTGLAAGAPLAALSLGEAEVALLDKAVAGSTAMVLECVAANPLDVVKTRFQLSHGRVGGAAVAGAMRELWTTGSLWRGLAPAVLMQLPRGALKFTVADSVRASASGLPCSAFVGGAVSGCIEAVMITPFERVKVRAQALDAAGHGGLGGSAGVLRDLLRTEGGSVGLTKGMEATLWRNGLWNGAYFGLQAFLPRCFPVLSDRCSPFFLGCLSGAGGSFLSTPVDVVKSRIQNSDTRLSPWVMLSVFRVAREEGVAALYRGLVPKLLRLGLGGGLLLWIYDHTHRALRARRDVAHAAGARR